MAKLKRGDRVEVHWSDITAFQGWQSRDDWETMVCVSVGYVVRVRKTDLAIAQDLGDVDEKTKSAGQVGNIMLIPKSNILKVRKLR